jgi:hypothetical protein
VETKNTLATLDQPKADSQGMSRHFIITSTDGSKTVFIPFHRLIRVLLAEDVRFLFDDPSSDTGFFAVTISVEVSKRDAFANWLNIALRPGTDKNKPIVIRCSGKDEAGGVAAVSF